MVVLLLGESIMKKDWGWEGPVDDQLYIGPHENKSMQAHGFTRLHGKVQLHLCRTLRNVDMWLYRAKLIRLNKQKMFYTEEEAKAWVTVMVRM